MVKAIGKKRHRGIYKFGHESPYELSRTRIENFIKCPACFFLEQVKGIKFPSMPGFNINEATDVLLKKRFCKVSRDPTTPSISNRIGIRSFGPIQT